MAKIFSLNNLYKISILIGILLITAILLYVHQLYQAHDQTELEIAETSSLNKLELQSLNQQYASLQAAIQQTRYTGPTEAENNHEIVEYSSSEKQKLQTEVMPLEKQIQIAQAKATILEQTRQKLRQQFFTTLSSVVAILVLGSLLCILGCLGWIYHIKIYRDRRQQKRNTTTT